jgi:hypothetical protein
MLDLSSAEFLDILGYLSFIVYLDKYRARWLYEIVNKLMLSQALQGWNHSCYINQRKILSSAKRGLYEVVFYLI